MEAHTSPADFGDWFNKTYGHPTPVQSAAWSVIRSGAHALVLAGTGQGKTLAAWCPLVERLTALSGGKGVRALHIVPLKALARDVCNSLEPIARVGSVISGRSIRVGVRCGDTPAAERRQQQRTPPDMLCTTPETLFVLLGSQGGRRLLKTVQAVVVDEWHALADNKRGAHLTLSLARLDALCRPPVQRIGLSATARPADALAAMLTGGQACEVIDPEPPAGVDLQIECPDMPLGPFATTLHWQQAHARVASLAVDHGARSVGSGSMLVFCQTRAQVERSAAALDELLTEAGFAQQVGAHHGSLDAAHRERVEAGFKAGELRVLVSSASLELGLDLGRVDRVCQLGVPGSANVLRQRAGRSRHRPGETPCIHLFAMTLNQLVEAHAINAVLDRGVIEHSALPPGAEDVLAQQLIAMFAAGEQDIDALIGTVRAAWPWRDCTVDDLEALLESLSASLPAMPDGQCQTLVRRDAEGRWCAEKSAEVLVRINAGTIPEFFEYEVVCQSSGEPVGRLDEEFAFESSPGQVIQLGHRSWRILRVTTGRVWVEEVDEDCVELPFWFGEGRGRSPEMVSAMLAAIDGNRWADKDRQVGQLLEDSKSVLGALPSATRLIIECFPDPGGDRHIVLHTFAGARINRAWGLALRKRFCRQFNFELQAAATDDGILISLGVTSQFELAEVAHFVRSHNVEDVLTQALLDTPLFLTRFRWCANNALTLLRNDLKGRVAAQRQRSQTENLVASVFPDQLACLENLSGPRQVPDHPLVRQALRDCLHEYMDLDGLQDLLGQIESGQIEIHALTLDAPSPLSEALIHAPRFSFLDEAAAEERRTRAFEGRPLFGRTSAARRKRRSPVVRQRPPAVPAFVAQPTRDVKDDRPPTADVLEAWLSEIGFLSVREGEQGVGLARPAPPGGWTRAFRVLIKERRAATVRASEQGAWLWVTPDRLVQLQTWIPRLECRPWLMPAMLPQVDVAPASIPEVLLAARRTIEPDIDRAGLLRRLGLVPSERAA